MHIPALNIVVGMVLGEGCMITGIWPSGGQSAALDLGPHGKWKGIDSLSLDTAGREKLLLILHRAAGRMARRAAASQLFGKRHGHRMEAAVRGSVVRADAHHVGRLRLAVLLHQQAA